MKNDDVSHRNFSELAKQRENTEEDHWSFSNHTLTITGSGSMQSYAPYKRPAWFEYEIYKVVIKDGITKIGDYAFANCRELTKVQLPDSLTVIGKNAFSCCSSLMYFRIPKHLKTIHSFSGCDLLQSFSADGCEYFSTVDGVLYDKAGKTLICYPNARRGAFSIPEGVVNIAKGALSPLYMDDLTLPASLDQQDDGFLQNCEDLQNIHVTKDNKTYSDTDGVLYNKDMTVLYAFPSGRTGKFIIPDTVYKIADYAFYHSCVTNIQFNNSQSGIGSHAFEGCTEFNTADLPYYLILLGDCAFKDCRGLTDLRIGDKLRYIAREAFYGCRHLYHVRIGNNVQCAGVDAFYDCQSIDCVEYDKSEKDWKQIDFTHGNESLMKAEVLFDRMEYPPISMEQHFLENKKTIFFGLPDFLTAAHEVFDWDEHCYIPVDLALQYLYYMNQRKRYSKADWDRLLRLEELEPRNDIAKFQFNQSCTDDALRFCAVSSWRQEKYLYRIQDPLLTRLLQLQDSSCMDIPAKILYQLPQSALYFNCWINDDVCGFFTFFDSVDNNLNFNFLSVYENGTVGLNCFPVIKGWTLGECISTLLDSSELGYEEKNRHLIDIYSMIQFVLYALAENADIVEVRDRSRFHKRICGKNLSRKLDEIFWSYENDILKIQCKL